MLPLPAVSPGDVLGAAVASVPAGAWAVGVSGGADSVALLSLLRHRDDLTLHVVHLDHQLRGPESTDDAAFVEALCRGWGVACTIDRRDRLERDVAQLPQNSSARYRRLRLALFERVVRGHSLHGVILAHHADDQAETVLQRLLRGSGYAGLAGMSADGRFGSLRVLRPLLEVRRETLRLYLGRLGQPWREDASNDSCAYLRNRLRAVLRAQEGLTPRLLELSRACRDVGSWVRRQAPAPPETLPLEMIRSLPPLIARHVAARWLVERGVPTDRIEPPVVEQLSRMATDAGSPPRQHFPGGVLVRRRQGTLSVVFGLGRACRG